MKLRRWPQKLAAIAFVLALTGCSFLTNVLQGKAVVNQHPGLAMNEADCAETGAAIALLAGLGSNLGGGMGAVVGPMFGTVFGKAACGLWDGAINGQPAATVVTTTQTTATTKNAN